MAKVEMSERGKLPAEAPPPTNGFGVHMMTLRNFVAAGLDMKNKGDYESTVSEHARAPVAFFKWRTVAAADSCLLIAGSPADGPIRWQHQ